jgi:membrane peptidoglycan carboxypeptidase
MSISPNMRQAIVAIEDSRFLEHGGVDLRGVLRSVTANANAGGVQQGSSTLTMQYVKNVLVNQAATSEELAAARGKSITRKIREVRYAMALEQQYTKADILERYLNIAYFGAGAYGVEAAAHRYFSKAATDLTIPEAATLAGIVQSPTLYDPLRNPDKSTVRRDIVIKRMQQMGFITQAQADQATQTQMAGMLRPTTAQNGCTSSYAPFFCDYVLRVIRTDPAFGDTSEAREAFLRRGGYRIQTTLDPIAQQAAFNAITSRIPVDDPSGRAGAVSMVQPGTGQIIAMTQNRQWGTAGQGNTTYNYNVNASMGGTIGMQAGSTFKMFTLAAAIEQGIDPNEYIDASNPKTFVNFTNCETGAVYPPITVHNSTTSGILNMAQATAYSTNTYFMSIEERMGVCRPADIAESMGVTLANGNPLIRVPSFTLGTMEVSPLSMAGAYATVANHGVYCKPIAIAAIIDRDGKRLPVPSANCHEVINRTAADTVTKLLNGVINGDIPGRTGAPMALRGRQAAGKTGTTNDHAAVWFCGFTPQLAAAVWVGDPRGGFKFPMQNVTINGVRYGQVFGSTMPGPIWRDSMEAALAGKDVLPFDLQTPIVISTSVAPSPSAGALESPGAEDPGAIDPNSSASADPNASPSAVSGTPPATPPATPLPPAR